MEANVYPSGDGLPAPASIDLTGVRMLLVEDDPEVALALESYFGSLGAIITHAYDGEEGIAALRDEPAVDIVLLDVTLPRKNGFEVLRESQEMGLEAPVLMVTARGEKENILKGFGLGAQDYVVKPFDADDLLLRVWSLLGAAPAEGTLPPMVQVGDVLVNFKTGQAHRDGEPLHLDEMELEVLEALVRYRGRVVTRKRLVREALGLDQDMAGFAISADVVAGTVDRHVDGLRHKVEPDPMYPRYIETVYGLGYRLRV